MGNSHLRVLVAMMEYSVPPADMQEPGRKDLDRLNDWLAEADVMEALAALGHEVETVGVREDLAVLRKALEEKRPHIVFNQVEEFHGIGAFDQHVVSYLELLRVPYTGCGPKGMTLARDKALSKKILRYHRIKTPAFRAVPPGRKARLPAGAGFPVVVKSLTEEGSVGLAEASVVHDPAALQERTTFIHETLSTDAIVEEYVGGRELYVGVLGNRRLTVFPPRELVHGKAGEGPWIATYKAKWDNAYRERHGLANVDAEGLSAEELGRLARLCRRTYRALFLDGYARIDLRRTEAGEFFVLEANPNPFLAEYEDFALAAVLGGMAYPELIARILRLGLARERARGG